MNSDKSFMFSKVFPVSTLDHNQYLIDFDLMSFSMRLQIKFHFSLFSRIKHAFSNSFYKKDSYWQEILIEK